MHWKDVFTDKAGEPYCCTREIKLARSCFRCVSVQLVTDLPYMTDVHFSILQQVLPKDDSPEVVGKVLSSSTKAPEKPNFSLPIMSNNFRRFNARYVLD